MARIESNGFIGQFERQLEADTRQRATDAAHATACFDDGVDCVTDAPEGVRQHMPHEGDPYSAHQAFADDIRNGNAADAGKQLERMTATERHAELDVLYRANPAQFASLLQSFAAGDTSPAGFDFMRDELATHVATSSARANRVTGAYDLEPDSRAVHNEILGLNGYGAEDAKLALLGIEQQETKHFGRAGRNVSFDHNVADLEHSIDDPKWGATASMYREHPIELAQQLTHDLTTDRVAYRAKYDAVVSQMEDSSVPARAKDTFMNGATWATGAGTTSLKVDLLETAQREGDTVHVAQLIGDPALFESMSSNRDDLEKLRSMTKWLIQNNSNAAKQAMGNLVVTFAKEVADAQGSGDTDGAARAADDLGKVMGVAAAAGRGSATRFGDSVLHAAIDIMSLGLARSGEEALTLYKNFVTLTTDRLGEPDAHGKMTKDLLRLSDATYDAAMDPQHEIEDLDRDDPRRKHYEDKRESFANLIVLGYEKGYGLENAHE